MSRKKRIANEEVEFFKEQLFDAQQSLFVARSVKEARFLTNRINFLKEQLREVSRGV